MNYKSKFRKVSPLAGSTGCLVRFIKQKLSKKQMQGQNRWIRSCAIPYFD